MSRLVRIGCLCITLLTACGEGALNEYEPGPADTSGLEDAGTPGICVLSACPAPDVGVACCLGSGACGQDPTGLGAFCVPNPGQPWTDNVCVVADCPLPTIGNPCCTGFGTCGYDPTETGLVCIQNAVTDRTVPPEPTCDLEACETPEIGYKCCTNGGTCGIEYPNLPGLCAPIIEPTDAGPPEPIDTSIPDDPSVTGECPSYIGINGLPVWGCCSSYAVCGTFAFDACLLPAGTQIPVGPAPDADAGVEEPFLRCTPPAP